MTTTTGTGWPTWSSTRTSTGEWFIRRSTDLTLAVVAWGAPSLDDVPAPGNYTEAGMMPRADIAVYRRSTGVWSIRRVTDAGLTLVPWGAPALQDVPAPADYDGDGQTDIAVYRRSTGVWFILPHRRTRGSARSPGAALPERRTGARRLRRGRPGTDVAVYRRSTGVWFIRRSRT